MPLRRRLGSRMQPPHYPIWVAELCPNRPARYPVVILWAANVGRTWVRWAVGTNRDECDRSHRVIRPDRVHPTMPPSSSTDWPGPATDPAFSWCVSLSADTQSAGDEPETQHLRGIDLAELALGNHRVNHDGRFGCRRRIESDPVPDGRRHRDRPDQHLLAAPAPGSGRVTRGPSDARLRTCREGVS